MSEVTDGVPKGFTRRGNKYWTRVPGDATREVGHPDLLSLVAWKKAYKQALRANEPLPPAPGSVGFPQPRASLSFRRYAEDVFLPWYRGKGNLTSTVTATEKNLDKVLKASWTAWALTGIREETLREWAAGLKASDVRPAVAKNMRGLVWSVFDRAVKDPDVPQAGNPAADIRPPVDRASRQRELYAARGALPLEMVSPVAERLHASYLIAFGLQLVAGLRVGAGFGAAVGSYLPAGADEFGWLTVRRQFSEMTYPVEDAGYRTRLVPWLKTGSSRRRIPIGPTLDAAIRDAVRRNYGHDFGDSWWDEPCSDSWDPAIVLNRDLPIVCPPAGVEVVATRIPHYREQLAQAAVELGIDLRKGPDDRHGPLIPHDLRKAFSTHLLDADADRAGRSVYLGHKHAAAWDESEVTAAVYSPATRKRLVSIALLAEQTLVPSVGPLIPPAPPTGEDALVTVTEGRLALGEPFSDETFRTYVRRAKIPKYPHAWRRKGTYYRLGDLRQLVNTLNGPDSIAASECAQRLFPERERQQAMMGLTREVRLGNLTRVRRGYYTRGSVEALGERFAAIDAGELITIERFTAQVNRTPADLGIDVFTCTRGRYVAASTVADAADLLPVDHPTAAASLGLDERTYWAVLHAFGRELAVELALDPSRGLAPAVLRALRERGTELAEAAVPATVSAEAVDESWIPTQAAAEMLDMDAISLDEMAMRLCWHRRVYAGEVYIHRPDVTFLELAHDAVPLPLLADRVGVSTERAEQLASEHGWMCDADGPVVLYSLAAVRACLAGQLSGNRPMLVDVSGAARLLGSKPATVQYRLEIGELEPYANPIGALLGRGGRRVALLCADQVRALLRAVPDGYVLTSVAARECGVKLSTLRKWAARADSPTVRDTSGNWHVHPADVQAAFSRDIPDGWLHVRDVVAGTVYDTRAYRNTLTRLAREGKVPGRKTGMPLAWHFPPETRDRLGAALDREPSEPAGRQQRAA